MKYQKLHPVIINEIQALYEKGWLTQQSIADKFNISRSRVRNVITKSGKYSTK
jgi:DNA-binding transcriptional regulator LsrR (DeoR family)